MGDSLLTIPRVEALTYNKDSSLYQVRVIYLLLYGDLLTIPQKEDFKLQLNEQTLVHKQVHQFYQGFRRDAHTMAVMVGVVGALSAFYHDSLDISDPAQRELASLRLVAKMPTLAAMAYK